MRLTLMIVGLLAWSHQQADAAGPFAWTKEESPGFVNFLTPHSSWNRRKNFQESIGCFKNLKNDAII
ncbi:MAG: hypothetical protein ABIX00_12355 [Polaromonas sp.]